MSEKKIRLTYEDIDCCIQDIKDTLNEILEEAELGCDELAYKTKDVDNLIYDHEYAEEKFTVALDVANDTLKDNIEVLITNLETLKEQTEE